MENKEWNRRLAGSLQLRGTSMLKGLVNTAKILGIVVLPFVVLYLCMLFVNVLIAAFYYPLQAANRMYHQLGWSDDLTGVQLVAIALGVGTGLFLKYRDQRLGSRLFLGGAATIYLLPMSISWIV